MNKIQNAGSAAPKGVGRSKQVVLTSQIEKHVKMYKSENPNTTVRAIRQRLIQDGVCVFAPSISSISRLVRRLTASSDTTSGYEAGISSYYSNEGTSDATTTRPAIWGSHATQPHLGSTQRLDDPLSTGQTPVGSWHSAISVPISIPETQGHDHHIPVYTQQPSMSGQRTPIAMDSWHTPVAGCRYIPMGSWHTATGSWYTPTDSQQSTMDGRHTLTDNWHLPTGSRETPQGNSQTARDSQHTHPSNCQTPVGKQESQTDSQNALRSGKDTQMPSSHDGRHNLMGGLQNSIGKLDNPVRRKLILPETKYKPIDKPQGVVDKQEPSLADKHNAVHHQQTITPLNIWQVTMGGKHPMMKVHQTPLSSPNTQSEKDQATDNEQQSIDLSKSTGPSCETPIETSRSAHQSPPAGESVSISIPAINSQHVMWKDLQISERPPQEVLHWTPQEGNSEPDSTSVPSPLRKVTTTDCHKVEPVSGNTMKLPLSVPPPMRKVADSNKTEPDCGHPMRLPLSVPLSLPHKNNAKVIFSCEQLKALEELFNKKHHPERQEKELLAERLQLPTKSVNVWFANRRQRWKKTVSAALSSIEGYETWTSSTISHRERLALAGIPDGKVPHGEAHLPSTWTPTQLYKSWSHRPEQDLASRADTPNPPNHSSYLQQDATPKADTPNPPNHSSYLPYALPHHTDCASYAKTVQEIASMGTLESVPAFGLQPPTCTEEQKSPSDLTVQRPQASALENQAIYAKGMQTETGGEKDQNMLTSVLSRPPGHTSEGPIQAWQPQAADHQGDRTLGSWHAGTTVKVHHEGAPNRQQYESILEHWYTGAPLYYQPGNAAGASYTQYQHQDEAPNSECFTHDVKYTMEPYFHYTD